MSDLALLCTLVFVAVTMLISVRSRLGLEKDIAIGTIRSAVQLLAIGYVLHYIFGAGQLWLMVVLIGVMIAVASWNAGARAGRLVGIRWRIAAAIGCTEAIAMTLLLVLGVIEPRAQYIIPISGIIIGSSMIVAGLLLNQLGRELETSRGEIEALLALGADARQSLQLPLKRAVRASMIPTVDSMKTVGLVQLPGMMTGMIVAGADPMEAVRYQVLIMFVLAASAAMTAMLLGAWSYRLLLTPDLRLLEPDALKRSK
ncbi:ABC transporter permease [Paenibacillus sp. YYML68]|uniref:ABC transporter permease n=1 Tax=Paenibacillus sp. YYML68 TaxID=2909250 RepID=UPI00249149AD|nr:iron export ABC transporter permease subunit FetB [Paenibacillus sp. YYML68]